MSRNGILWVAGGSALWGTDAVLRRLLAAALPPVQLVFYEHLLLAVVAVPLLWNNRRSVRFLGLRHWLAIVGLAWMGSALSTVLFTLAVTGGNPTTAVFIQKLQPLFAIALARGLLGERWPRAFPGVVVIAFVGGYLLSFGGEAPAGHLSRLELPAAWLALGAAAGWGSSTVFGRFVSGRVPFYALTSLRILVALPALAVASMLQGVVVPQVSDLPALLLLSFVPGFCALVLYYRGLRDTSASLASIGELAFPATAALLNWAFLSVATGAVQIAGLAIIWFSILFLRRRLE